MGPDYVRPALDIPADFKETQGWKPAEPRDELPRDRWWEIYGDENLDALMDQIDVSNQSIKQAEAQYRAARALVQSARAAYFPTLSAGGSFERSASSVAAAVSNAPSTTGTTNPGATGTNGSGVTGTTPTNPSIATIPSGSPATGNLLTASLDASWEVDIWGKLRRAAENATANMRASIAELGAARLSAQAELAQDYFQLRITDEEKRLYEANVQGLEKSLKITQNQYQLGIAASSDVAQALTLLRSTKAAAIDLAITRDQVEHAIATLLGKPVSKFSLPPAPLKVRVPTIPLSQPSDLLERRPDIAASERQVAAANANIGVAKAAFYPSLSLSAAFGYETSGLSGLLAASNRFWSVGPTVAHTLFDGAARRALSNQAIANYEASVAVYRQTVLSAFQDTEDNLASLRVLADENVVQDEATEAADQSESIALNQYKSGIVSYLNVSIAQTSALANERASLTVRARQLASSVALVKSLGGSWRPSLMNSL